MSVVVWIASDNAVFPPEYANRELGNKTTWVGNLYLGESDLVRHVDGHFFGPEYVAHDFADTRGRINRRLDRIEYAPNQKSIRYLRIVLS